MKLLTAAALALAFAATSAHAGHGFVNGITANGLTANGITSNGLTSNGITANGITSNGLTSNGITSNGSMLLPTESCACGWSSNDATIVGSTVLIGVELPK
jgi:hypothetical protein